MAAGSKAVMYWYLMRSYQVPSWSSEDDLRFVAVFSLSAFMVSFSCCFLKNEIFSCNKMHRFLRGLFNEL